MISWELVIMQIITQDHMSEHFPLEATMVIISVIISSAISLTVLIYREHKVEPNRWKKNVKLDTLDKRLTGYGRLLNLLQATEERAKGNEASSLKEEMSHLLSMPEDAYEYHEIFKNYRHFFSPDVVKYYLESIKNDKLYQLSPNPSKDNNKSLLLINFKSLHNATIKEFEELKKERETLTGYKF